MVSKILRIFMASMVSILLFACGVDTEEAISGQAEESIESTDVQSENAESTEDVEKQEQEAEEVSDKADEAKVEETSEDEDKQVEAVESEPLEKLQDRALIKLIEATHLEKEGYSYFFSETESADFIQIEVREIQETNLDHISLEGVYQYIIKTEEILVRDYLTGDFIPYVKTE